MLENKKKSLAEFCKENIVYIFVTFLCVMAIYGAWAFQYFISFDAEGFYLETSRITINSWYMQWIGLGRWAFVVLKKVLGILSINPFFSIGIFMVFFPISAILWNYLFENWGIKQNNTSRLFFNILYLSNPIWALQYAYRNQIEVLSIIAVILPIAIYYFINYFEKIYISKKILSTDSLYLLISMLAIVFCFAGYQSFIVMFMLSIVIYCFINIIQNRFELKEFYKKLIILIILFGVIFGIYFVLSNIFRTLVGINYSGYLTSQVIWLNSEFSKCCNIVFKELIHIFIGDNIAYTCILIIEFLLGIPIIVLQMRKINNIGLKIWSAIIYVSLFIIALILTILTTEIAVVRQQFAYVLLVAFLGAFEFNYYTENINIIKKVSIFYGIIFLIISYVVLIFAEKNTRLLYSDYFTMKNDYLKMEEIYNRAREKGAKNGDAIAFVGINYNPSIESIVKYEVIGLSYFEITYQDYEKLTEAMIGYGFEVTKPNLQQRQYAQDRSHDMESYPSENSIVVENGLIVVKLSGN